MQTNLYDRKIIGMYKRNLQAIQNNLVTFFVCVCECVCVWIHKSLMLSLHICTTQIIWQFWWAIAHFLCSTRMWCTVLFVQPLKIFSSFSRFNFALFSCIHTISPPFLLFSVCLFVYCELQWFCTALDVLVCTLFRIINACIRWFHKRKLTTTMI